MSVYAGPASGGHTVTPNDSTDLPEGTSRALWVGSTGNIRMDFKDGGQDVLIASVPAGSLLPFQVSRIRSSGTTASDIVAIY